MRVEHVVSVELDFPYCPAKALTLHSTFYYQDPGPGPKADQFGCNSRDLDLFSSSSEQSWQMAGGCLGIARENPRTQEALTGTKPLVQRQNSFQRRAGPHLRHSIPHHAPKTTSTTHQHPPPPMLAETRLLEP